jgi:hypothetical protein
VWIIWIGLAPLLQNLFIEWFLFLNVRGPARACRLMPISVQSRVSVLTDSAITALVFTHALRARLINKPEDGRAPEPYKSVQLSKPKDDTDPTISTEGAQVPEGQSAGEDFQVDVETVHSRAESSATAASTLGPAANGNDGRDAKKAKKADKTKQTPDLLGRLDNLVTGDLQSIGNAKSWPQLREASADYPPYDAEALMMLLQLFAVHCCLVLARGCSSSVAIARVNAGAASDGFCTPSSAGRPGSGWL